MIVISGFSGSGRTQVMNQMFKNGRVSPIVTYTTKDCQNGFGNGIMEFMDIEKFSHRASRGGFLVKSFVDYNGERVWYGIPKVEEKCLGLSTSVLGRLDFLDTLLTIAKRNYTDIFNVFIDVDAENILFKKTYQGLDFYDRYKNIDDVKMILAREYYDLKQLRENADLIIDNKNLQLTVSFMARVIYNRYMKFLEVGRRSWERETARSTGNKV